MAGYDYNINLNVIVKDKQLDNLEKRLQRLNNMKISPKFDPKSSFENGFKKYNNEQSSYLKSFQREQSVLARNLSSFGRDFSKSAADINRSFTSLRQTNSLGRRMGVAREKGSRLMDVGAGVGSYIGLSSLKKILYDIPVQAETNKWLMSTMGDSTASSDALYKQLDVTTDKLPISMQSVAQPLYAFKAATGENAEVIKDIIPQFANFGAVVQNMTGSTELAETAMMKLGYGIKGRYAALDQYGITEDALKRAGWSGDENDVKGYMAAVTKIVGNAEDSMSTFAGQVKLVEKSLARTGKRIWESGVGDALKGVLGFVNAFLEAGDGIFAKLGVGAVSITTAFLGITAASGYLLQAIGSMGESFLILKEAIGDASNVITTKLGGIASVKSMEKQLAAQQVPMYYAGIHDYDERQLANSGFSRKQRDKIDKSKKRDRRFVQTFGYGDEYKRQRKAILSDPTLKGKDRTKALKNLRKSRLNEINAMGFRGRIREVGKIRSIKAVGGAFKQGWSANTGLGKVTGGFSKMGSVLGSLIGVINPFNIALAAIGVAIGALATVFATAYMSSEQFRQHVSKVGKKLMDLGQTFMGVVGDVFQMAGISSEGGIQGIVEVADNILSAIEGGFDWLKGVMEGFTGKDYKQEEAWKKGYESVKTAENNIREAQKQGKEGSKEDYETLKWWYGTKENNYQGRRAYLSRGGGYWDTKYDELEQQYPGLHLDRTKAPSENLNLVKEYNLGDLGIPGIGKARTYNPDVVTQQQQERNAAFKAMPTNWGMLAIGELIGLGGTSFQERSKTAAGVTNQTTTAISDPMLQQPGASLDRLEVSADNAATTLDQISGVDSSSVYNNSSLNLTTPSVYDSDFNASSIIASNKEAMEQFKTDYNLTMDSTYGNMSSQIDTYSPQVGTSVSTLGSNATSNLQSTMNLSSVASDESGHVVSNIHAKSPQVGSASASMGSTASSDFGSSLSFEEWVSQEIDDLISSIQSKIPSVATAAASLASAAYSAITTQNQNASPGLIARWGGQEVMWMAEQIRKRTPTVVSSARNLVDNIHRNYEGYTPSFNYDMVMATSNLAKQNPVDVYNSEINKEGIRGTPSVTQSDTKAPRNQDNSQVINLTFNIEKVDSEERVNEIKNVIYDTLFFNNETAGRTEPTPLGGG